MKRAGCCSATKPSNVPRHRTTADRRGTRKAAMVINSGKSAALSSLRGVPKSVPVARQVGAPATLPDLSALSFADQKLPLGRGHLSDESLEKLSFFDPSAHLLMELRGNVKSPSPPVLLPREQGRFMDRTFPSAATGGIPAPFLAYRKRCLNEGLDSANPPEDAFPGLTGQFRSRHDGKYIYLP